jgi:hypothetical protein
MNEDNVNPKQEPHYDDLPESGIIKHFQSSRNHDEINARIMACGKVASQKTPVTRAQLLRVQGRVFGL